MGKISDRLSELARRCGDLSPIRESVRQVLINGNRQRALAGIDYTGRPYASLKPSTLKRRKGTGPPLAPRGASSRIVTDYTVQVTAGPAQLTFVASWPDCPWMEFHITGTDRMAQRNPSGFRQDDLDQIRKLMKQHVIWWRLW